MLHATISHGWKVVTALCLWACPMDCVLSTSPSENNKLRQGTALVHIPCRLYRLQSMLDNARRPSCSDAAVLPALQLPAHVGPCYSCTVANLGTP
jgi:hypothetical protein